MELGSGKTPVAERDSLTNGQSTIAMEDYGTTSGGRQRAEDKIRILADQDDVEMESNLYNRTTSERRLNRECYFQDGVRPIDFVLVYEEDIQTLEDRKAGKIGKKKDKSLMTDKDRFDLWREKFMANLAKVGLQFEEESIESAKKMIYFIKIHVPWDVLCIHGEDLMLRAPLQLQPSSDVNWSARLLNCCKLPNIMDQDVPNKPLHYYTCAFKRTKLSRFLGAEMPETFFPTRDRHRVAYEILAKTVYGKKKRAEIGIDRLLEEGIYSAAYPLHDGPDDASKEQLKHPDQLNARQVLYEYWARWGCWYKYQPLDHIREYFGEKIGIYFAWLGFYTAWLLPASVVGLIVFLFGVITMDTNTAAKETCESGGKYLMCPQCDAGCPYWNLSDSCIYVQIAYLFDQPGTVFYAIFMSFWAVTFLEYWKRKTANLAYHWDCLDFQDEEERPRPEYAAKCTQYEKNPITGVREPYFPPRDRLPRILSGIGVIVMMIVLVLIFIVAVIMYRVLMIIILNQQSGQSVLKSQSNAVAGLSASVVNLIIILALGKVYEKLALKLTQWEMHRTQSEFEDQLIFKVFIFQFVNFYSSIIYIGFFKGKLENYTYNAAITKFQQEQTDMNLDLFVGYPGHYSHMLGLRQEECQNNSCLVELAEQLGVIMIGKQIINNAQELLVPKMKAFVHKWKIGKMEKNVHKTRWEEDYEMIENEGLFEEYLEMVLQFGFITIFVAAFPLAPLFALLNNWMEIRLDAHKFVCETRRPVAERCQDIGVWFRILDGLAQLAVISNAFLIAFTSEFLPKQLYSYQYDSSLSGYVEYSLAWAPENSTTMECRYKDFRNRDGSHTEFYWKLLCIRLAFVILFEHVVFGVCRLIDVLVPDVPESLEIKIKREHYLAKQALADADTSIVFGGADEDETDKAQLQVT